VLPFQWSNNWHAFSARTYVYSKLEVRLRAERLWRSFTASRLVEAAVRAVTCGTRKLELVTVYTLFLYLRCVHLVQRLRLAPNNGPDWVFLFLPDDGDRTSRRNNVFLSCNMSPCALLPWRRPGTSLLAELVPQVLSWPAVTITVSTQRRALHVKLTSLSNSTHFPPFVEL
jgi:hypothetical protein